MFTRRLLLLFFLIAGTLSASGFGAPSWERPPQPAVSGDLTSLLVPPEETGKVIIASSHEIFEGFSNGQWKGLWHTGSGRRKIRNLLHFKERPGDIFVLTDDGAFKGDLKSNKWAEIFRGKSGAEKNVLSFAVSPEDSAHWFAGTAAGLFESEDGGKTWYRFSRFSSREPVPVLRFIGKTFFAATGRRLYASDDGATFRPVFSLVSGDSIEFLELEEQSAAGEDETISSSDFHEIAGRPEERRLWLATEKGVFESTDGGARWSALSQSGLRSTKVNYLTYSEKSERLFAGTPLGIYAYHPEEKRWVEIFRGLAHAETRGLAIQRGEKERLVAVTGDGFVSYPLDDVRPQSVWVPSPDKAGLLQKLFRLEPTARDVQQAVVDYGNLRNGKINRWHAESRLRSLIPALSVGNSFTRNNNIDIDRGSTNEPDRFIFGPEDRKKDVGVDLKWDFADFVWGSNQTSIDSREKLMVELRNDFLAEATRIYYERRRLQMDIVFNPAPSEMEHFDKILRMDELTSLLDGMTGGFMSARLEEIYRRESGFGILWQFQPAPQDKASHSPAGEKP